MTGRMRIDKWLWHARFYRTRARARKAAASGLLRLNGARLEKPGAAIHPGDIVTVPCGREIVAVRVEALAERRHGAPEARRLYSILAGDVLDPQGPAS